MKKTISIYIQKNPILIGVVSIVATILLGVVIAFVAGAGTPKVAHAQLGPPCCTLPPPPLPPPPPPPAPPIIILPPPASPTCTLSASVTSFSYSGGNSTLSWTTSHTSSASINNGVGSVSATGGSKQIHVSTTGTYVLSVVGAGGKATCDAKIVVASPPPAPTCTLSASPNSIQTGGSSTLTYTTTHATSFTINHSVGTLTPVAGGSTHVSPTQTTTYAGTANGAGGKVTCETKVTVTTLPPSKPKPFTITATKIICGKESDLPNWSGTGHIMTKSTAINYVEAHSDCHLASGWAFEWANGGTPNPGNEKTIGGSGWTSFGPTASTGTATATFQKIHTARVWAREEFKPGYIPFAGDAANASSVSAELYCNTDVLNYDNYDAVTNPHTGKAYYCVAWNVLKKTAPPPTPAPTCTLSASPNSIQTGGSSTLTYTTTHATSFTINHSVGTLTPVAGGSTHVSPTQTTTYTGTANGAGGTAVCHATVTHGGGGGGGGPMCVLIASPTTISSGGTATLSWGGSGIKNIFIDNGVGTTTGTNGSVSVSPSAGAHTYTGTFTAFSGQKLKCSSTVTVTGGGGGTLPPVITLTSFRKSPPSNPLAMVYLSQFPSTGLYLGTVGTIIYWLILIVWSVALAYVLLFIVMPFIKRRTQTFGAQVRTVLNVQPTQQNEMVPPLNSETFAQSHDVAEDRSSHSSYNGFRSFAQSGALSVEDIVQGLSRGERKYEGGDDAIPEPVRQSMATAQYDGTHGEDASSTLSGILSTQTMTRSKDTQGQTSAELSSQASPLVEEQHLVQTNEADTASVASTRGFLAALLEGDRTAVFYALRQVARGGGDTARFLADATCMLDDAFRARIDGTDCDPDVVRLVAKYQTPALEEIITALATAIDASYSSNVTASKLALTRALARIGA